MTLPGERRAQRFFIIHFHIFPFSHCQGLLVQVLIIMAINHVLTCRGMLN